MAHNTNLDHVNAGIHQKSNTTIQTRTQETLLFAIPFYRSSIRLSTADDGNQ